MHFRNIVSKLIWSILFVVLLFLLFLGATTVYVIYNQQSIIDSFLAELKKQDELTMEYSNFQFSATKYFPFATFTFNDFFVAYPNSSKTDTLIAAKSISFKINTLKLIASNYYVKECDVTNGLMYLNTDKIDQITKQYSSGNTNQSDSLSEIRIERFSLNNFDLISKNLQGKLLYDININNSLIYFDLSNNQFQLSLKSTLNSFSLGNTFRTNFPIELSGRLNKIKNLYELDDINITFNTIKLKCSGLFNESTNELKVDFESNNINLNRITSLINLPSEIQKISGYSRISGSITTNLNTSNVDNLTLYHKSKNIEIQWKNDNINIVNLEGVSYFSKNFKYHTTQIDNIDIYYQNYKAKLKGKIKGTKNPICLLEGNILMERSNKNILGKMFDINASGKVKGLFEILNLNEQPKIVYHRINSSINFNIGNIDGADRLKDISGTIDINNNFYLKSSGKFDGSNFDLSIKMKNFIGYLNNSTGLSPLINVNAESLDVDYILNTLTDTSSSTSNTQYPSVYRINLNSKNLNYDKYSYQNVSALITIRDSNFDITNLVGSGFGGNFNANITNVNNNYKVIASFNGIDIKEIFTHFNNFSQTLITDKNINGQLNGYINLQFDLDNQYNILYPSLNAESDITINNGKLMGMNKIEKLSKWLRLDQVKSIDFKTLHNTIKIADQCVHIPLMNVSSNVINLQLTGEHFFAGNFTYWIKVNVSQVLARRFFKATSSNDIENNNNGSFNLSLKILGDTINYDVILDKNKTIDKVKSNLQSDGVSIKQLIKNELLLKDSSKSNNFVDSSRASNNKFRIEWDEFDTLKVENN